MNKDDIDTMGHYGDLIDYQTGERHAFVQRNSVIRDFAQTARKPRSMASVRPRNSGRWDRIRYYYRRIRGCVFGLSFLGAILVTLMFVVIISLFNRQDGW